MIRFTSRSLGHLFEGTEGVLAGVGDVQESVVELHVSLSSFPATPLSEGEGRYVPILILVLFVDAAHERSSRWQDLVDEDEDRFLGRELDALADHVDELAYGQVGGNQVLLLVDGRDIRLFDLFTDDGDTVGVFLALQERRHRLV